MQDRLNRLNGQAFLVFPGLKARLARFVMAGLVVPKIFERSGNYEAARHLSINFAHVGGFQPSGVPNQLITLAVKTEGFFLARLASALRISAMASSAEVFTHTDPSGH
jgi:hypothetical protein